MVHFSPSPHPATTYAHLPRPSQPLFSPHSRKPSQLWQALQPARAAGRLAVSAEFGLATIAGGNHYRARHQNPDLARNARFTKKNTSSRYRGVWYNSQTKKYRAAIVLNRKRKHLGYFHSETDAAKAYDSAAKKYHGEFAALNFPHCPQFFCSYAKKNL